MKPQCLENYVTAVTGLGLQDSCCYLKARGAGREKIRRPEECPFVEECSLRSLQTRAYRQPLLATREPEKGILQPGNSYSKQSQGSISKCIGQWLTHTRVTWVEGALIEEFFHQIGLWAFCGARLWNIFLIANCYERAHPTWAVLPLGRWVGAIYKKVAEQARTGKPVSSLPLWLLQQNANQGSTE